jgi:hypothetical protein
VIALSFLRNFVLATALVSLGWLYVQIPATVGIGGFLSFLQNPSTAILVIGLSTALVVLEWFS